MHLFSLHYLPQIKYLQSLLHCDAVCFEMAAHYQRQTYHNRCEIYTANGLHKLIVPIEHRRTGQGRGIIKDTRISYADNWQLQHQRTISTAYQSSSYFEYLEDDFMKLYQKKHVFLADLNIASIELLLGILKKPFSYSTTQEYFKIPDGMTDLRNKFEENNHTLDTTYYQVFQSKHGFIGNLSSIDLLFNTGPKSFDNY